MKQRIEAGPTATNKSVETLFYLDKLGAIHINNWGEVRYDGDYVSFEADVTVDYVPIALRNILNKFDLWLVEEPEGEVVDEVES